MEKSIDTLKPVVHVIDDEASIRSSVTFLLQTHGIPTRSYATGIEFLQSLSGHEPRGVILLDIRMEPISGLQVHDEIIARSIKTPVLFLSGHGDIPMAVDALQKGASDFIEKPFNADNLIRRVLKFMEKEAREHTADFSAADDQLRLDSLTKKEYLVMLAVAQGKRNKVIADELCISVRTVEVHRAKIFLKLGVRSAAELATLLVRCDASLGIPPSGRTGVKLRKSIN